MDRVLKFGFIFKLQQKIIPVLISCRDEESSASEAFILKYHFNSWQLGLGFILEKGQRQREANVELIKGNELQEMTSTRNCCDKTVTVHPTH